MKAKVRIYGKRREDVQGLIEAIKREFEETPTFGDFADDPDQPEIGASDIVICFVGESQEDAEYAIKSLRLLVTHHGAFAYVATVVVGSERFTSRGIQLPQAIKDMEVGQRERPLTYDSFLKVGASRYIRAGMSDTEIVVQARAAFERIWWFGAQQQSDAVIVVNMKGTILKANGRAFDSFGPGLVGSRYCTTIEPSDSSPFPSGHPIVGARSTGRVSSGARHWRHSNGEKFRYYLIAHPLKTNGKAVRSIGLTMVNLHRREVIVHSYSDLFQAKSIDDLCRDIVSKCMELGFKQASLYKWNQEGRESLELKESAGERVPRQSIPVATGRHAGEQARLWAQRQEGIQSADTEYMRYFEGSPEFAQPFLNCGIRRWIEAPIWLPVREPRQGDPRAREWGMLHVDFDKGSERLDTTDVLDIRAFTTVVAAALQAMEECETSDRQRKAVRVSGAELVGSWEQGSLEKAVEAVEKMVLSHCNADVAFYRELVDGPQAQLRRIREHPVYANDIAKAIQVPKDLYTDNPETYFPVFNEELENPPCCILIPDGTYHSHISSQPGMDKEVKQYLGMIRSELQIPVYRGARVHGVVCAISRRPGAFSPEVVAGAEQLVGIASTWIELSRDRSARLWVDRTLDEIIATLQLLAGLPLTTEGDTQFFAALSTILTAHNGLQWNRSLLFECAPFGSNSCQLRDAIGGTGTPDGQKEHREKTQRPLADDKRFEKLKTLVEYRMANLVPTYFPSNAPQNGVPDSLYELCFSRNSRPIELLASDQVNSTALLGTTVLDQILNRRIEPNENRLNPIELKTGDGREPWCADLMQNYEGIFPLGKTVYAFPLWCMYNYVQELVGIALVDVQSRTENSIGIMKGATSSVLGLAADLLASRHAARRLGGAHRILPAIVHPSEGRPLRTVWDAFLATRKRMKDNLEALASVSVNEDVPRSVEGMGLSHKVIDFNQWSSWSDRETALLDELKGKVDRIRNAPESPYAIDNLGEYLRRFCRPFGSRIRLVLDDGVNGFPLPCDPLILGDVLSGLYQNSFEASESGQLSIELRAHLKPPVCNNFKCICKLVFSDNGPGIKKDLWPYVFMRGATGARYADERGVGLGVLRMQLAAFHGELRQLRNGKNGGARFSICFGVPKPGVGKR